MSKITSRGWHSRGYLPHFDGGNIPQAVTFRLADSLPKQRLEALENELACLPENEVVAERRQRIEAHLDLGLGHAWLTHLWPSRSRTRCFTFDGARYFLHAWVLMPNHVHTLLTPLGTHTLSRIVHSWKSFTANVANCILAETGKFWQEEYFDRYIRNERHYFAAVDYIELNPVTAGLCEKKDDWRFGSARRREEVRERNFS